MTVCKICSALDSIEGVICRNCGALQYTGSVFIGVVGHEQENGICRDSIEGITRREGDEGPFFIRATKGYEARQMHLYNWYEKSKHPFLLLLDHDMHFPPDMLEKLRGHQMPYVTGFYMRRTIRPVAPVWYEEGEAGVMPMRPMTAAIEKNKLYPLGASGWGAMLIHRDVVRDVKKLLKGEPEIIEDDMDLFPYDLPKLLKARQTIIDSLNGTPTTQAQAKEALETFVNEIRPLRAVKDTVGSDIRFPFYARLAGYRLWGDTGVCCGHYTNYPVGIDDWLNQPSWAMRDITLYIGQENEQESNRLQKAKQA